MTGRQAYLRLLLALLALAAGLARAVVVVCAAGAGHDRVVIPG